MNDTHVTAFVLLNPLSKLMTIYFNRIMKITPILIILLVVSPDGITARHPRRGRERAEKNTKCEQYEPCPEGYVNDLDNPGCCQECLLPCLKGYEPDCASSGTCKQACPKQTPPSYNEHCHRCEHDPQNTPKYFSEDGYKCQQCIDCSFYSRDENVSCQPDRKGICGGCINPKDILVGVNCQTDYSKQLLAKHQESEQKTTTQNHINPGSTTMTSAMNTTGSLEPADYKVTHNYQLLGYDIGIVFPLAIVPTIIIVSLIIVVVVIVVLCKSRTLKKNDGNTDHHELQPIIGNSSQSAVQTVNTATQVDQPPTNKTYITGVHKPFISLTNEDERNLSM